MLEGFHKALDRELGPAPGTQGGPAVRDPWIRDWPLLLGLALSAALVVVSVLIGASSAARATPATPKAASAGAGISGEVVDVGESNDAAAPSAEPAKNAHASK